MENCLFCKIASGQIASDIVYQDEDMVAFKDINPQAPVHILLITRRHIPSMAELTPEDGPLLGIVFSVAAKLAHKLGVDEGGYRVVTNVGRDAGQSVFHLHFHLLGGRKLAWPPG
ncbi:MAG: histidine triad nucleotide-binding protein [Ktedonobacteraceae bacterium]